MSKSTASGTDTTAGPHASFGREARAWLCDLGDVVARCVVEDNGLYPVFHGCYDWHSAVHGVWALHVIARGHIRQRWAQGDLIWAQVLRLNRAGWRVGMRWVPAHVGIRGNERADAPVSYTHLTLPTICSV